MFTVSIVVPTHLPLDDHRRYVYSSLLAQQHDLLQIHFVFNGLGRKDYLISKQFIQSNNIHGHQLFFSFTALALTPGQARRAAFQNIQTDFVLFSDSDDILDSSVVSTKLKLAMQTGSDIVVSDALVFST